MEVLASLVLLRSKLRGIEPLCSDFDSDVVPASQSHVLARQNKDINLVSFVMLHGAIIVPFSIRSRTVTLRITE